MRAWTSARSPAAPRAGPGPRPGWTRPPGSRCRPARRSARRPVRPGARRSSGPPRPWPRRRPGGPRGGRASRVSASGRPAPGLSARAVGLLSSVGSRRSARPGRGGRRRSARPPVPLGPGRLDPDGHVAVLGRRRARSRGGRAVPAARPIPGGGRPGHRGRRGGPARPWPPRPPPGRRRGPRRPVPAGPRPRRAGPARRSAPAAWPAGRPAARPWSGRWRPGAGPGPRGGPW